MKKISILITMFFVSAFLLLPAVPAVSQALQTIEEGPEMCLVIPESLGMTKEGAITIQAICKELVEDGEKEVKRNFVFDPSAVNSLGESPVVPLASAVLLMIEKVSDSRVKVYVNPLRAESERKAALFEMEPVRTVSVDFPMTFLTNVVGFESNHK